MPIALFAKPCLVCGSKAKITAEVMVYGYTRPVKRGFCSDEHFQNYSRRAKRFFDNYAPGCRTCLGGPK